MSQRATLALALLVAVSACAKTDASPAGQNVASSGDVSAHASNVVATPGVPTDSVSTLADAGRIRGSASAPVWLIEISDFQCPYCKQWHDHSFAAIDKDYVATGKVRLAYINYPIASLHPNARAAAEAAMCASVQGKFWEMHESLFNSQARWAPEPSPMATFDSLARSAGVNAASWQQCMTSHATGPIVEADLSRISSRGLQGTPNFYVGDKQIQGAQPLDSFRVAIEQALAKARGGK